ncbi:MAG: hypothetical protein JETT_2002 [Candidatus Jettenia ecosi]|uniref:Uncharacterized protein n=1 Tax=Candidatus Jettenia ecosi TaxID=2494326 RepID=A0A533QAH6_9BACT|nr:MAG: hypothetical protein JETT_2002 [Candidatus Jettenia ecosi]
MKNKWLGQIVWNFFFQSRIPIPNSIRRNYASFYYREF